MTVFVYYFGYVHLPFREAERRLLSAFGRLPALADSAYRNGETIRSRLGVGSERPLLAKQVELHIGEPVTAHAHTTIPLSWDATGTPGLFPKMRADLIIAPLGDDMAQVSLRGNYEPPMGAMGRALDRAVLHRVAESSVKAFLDDIVEMIEVDGANAP